MVEYPPSGYPGYGPAAYQCGNPYVSVGPNGYPTPVSSGYSPVGSGSCYTMPPPQHIPMHDKNGNLKDIG